MIRTSACLAILLSSITLVAQNGAPSVLSKSGTDESERSGQAAPQTNSISAGVIVIDLGTVEGCPIDMRAKQGVWDRTIRVRDGEKERGRQQFGQRISLSLKGAHQKRIVKATVRVRGLNGTSRAIPTPADDSQIWNTTRTLKVNFVEQEDGTVSADLRLAGFTAVGPIQLLNVSYSDGSVWTISRSESCSVRPDPLMLITEIH